MSFDADTSDLPPAISPHVSPHTMLSRCVPTLSPGPGSRSVSAPRCSVTMSGCDPLHRNVETDTSSGPGSGRIGDRGGRRQGYGHRTPAAGLRSEASSGSGSLHTCIWRSERRGAGTGQCTHPGSRCDPALHKRHKQQSMPHPRQPLTS